MSRLKESWSLAEICSRLKKLRDKKKQKFQESVQHFSRVVRLAQIHALEALDRIHRLNWMHGQSTPENIFISSSGQVIWLSYGCANRFEEMNKVNVRANTEPERKTVQGRLFVPARSDTAMFLESSTKLGASLGLPGFEGDTRFQECHDPMTAVMSVRILASFFQLQFILA